MPIYVYCIVHYTILYVPYNVHNNVFNAYNIVQ